MLAVWAATAALIVAVWVWALLCPCDWSGPLTEGDAR